MSESQEWLAEAVQLHRQGDLEAAEPLYRRVLQTVPHHLESLYLLGTLCLQRGNADESIKILTEVRSVEPSSPDLHNNLGIAFQSQGRLSEAAASFQRAIAIREDYAEAHFNLGALLEQEGRLRDAVEAYSAARQHASHDPQVHLRISQVLEVLELWHEAAAALEQYLTLQPEDEETRVRLVYLYAKLDRLDEAADLCRDILSRQPEYVEVYNNLSYIDERRGRLEDALQAAEQAVAIRPDYPEGHNNRGNALRSLHRLDGACTAFERALEIRPDFPLARFNLASTQMLAGDYRAGWPGYESREHLTNSAPPTFLQPRWTGEPLEGKTLLVHADEGLGDTIQFLRFLPHVQSSAGCRIVLQCQTELAGLLRNADGVDELIVERDFLPTADAHVSLLSLPEILEVSLESLPADVPYLQTDAQSSGAVDSLSEPVADKFLVGIVWQGNPLQPRDLVRSCPLSHFGELATLEGVTLVSLQTGQQGRKQLENWPAEVPIIDAGGDLKDFSDTAALISRLDLVITVDTSIAHLAGAMGTPTWTLLCHTPDWRWLLERDDSPWYPTMRLFRQRSWGDWEQVFTDVRRALAHEIDHVNE